MEISPTAVRYAFKQCVTTDDMQRVVDAVTEDATVGSPLTVDEEGNATSRHPRSAAAQKLWTAYVLGTPRKEPFTHRESVIDPDGLDTLEGCRAASKAILKAQLANAVDADEAQSLRQTVMLAMDTLKAENTARQTEAIEDLASDFVVLESGNEVETIRRIVEARKAKESTDGE